MALEIEKKFLLKPFNIENILKKLDFSYEKKKISQYYIPDGNPIRIRKYGNKYFLTIKKGEGLVREEYEKELRENEFKNLLSNAKNIRSIFKTRYIVKLKKITYEIDRFKIDLKGLYFLEVEFKNVDDANRFKINKIFQNLILADVTDDRRFSNFSLASTKTIPSLKSCKSIVDIEEIDPLCSTKEALKTILYSLFRRVNYFHQNILNEPQNIENLHQFRVSFRKIIVFLKEFKKFFDEKWIDNTYKDLKNFMEKTNQKRDLDVLISQFDDYLTHLPPSMKENLIPLKNSLIHWQNREEKRVFEILHSKEYKKILTLLNEAIQNDKVYLSESNTPIIVTSYNIIQKKKKKIFKLANLIDDKSLPKEYHKLRIEFKRLRYLLETFSHFYEDKEVEKFIKRCKKIQDILGAHQDLEVQREHIVQYIKKNSNLKIDTILAVGKLIGDMEFEEIKRREEFRKKYKKLSKLLKSSTIY